MNEVQKLCGAQVAFQSREQVKLADGTVISSGQGRLTCNYPKGVCQKRNKENSGFMVQVVKGECKVEQEEA